MLTSKFNKVATKYRIKLDENHQPIIPNIWRISQTLKEYWIYLVWKKHIKAQVVIPYEFSNRKLAKYFWVNQLKENKHFKIVSYDYIKKHNIKLLNASQWYKFQVKEGFRGTRLVYYNTSDIVSKYHKFRERRRLYRKRKAKGTFERLYKIKDYTSPTSLLYQNEIKDILEGKLPPSMNNLRF